MRFGSSNPMLRRALRSDSYAADYEVATYQGVAQKTFIYLALVLIGALLGITFLQTNNQFGMTLIGISAFATFIFALVSFFSPRRAKVFGSLYCIGQGMLVGVVSYIYNAASQGIVLTALVTTFVVFAVVATLYLTKMVVVNGRFQRFLLAFAIGFILSNIVLWIFMLISGNSIYMDNLGLLLLISAASAFLATLYLFFDLEMIRQIVEGGHPKSMEWYVSFGLVFTLLWLYVEILRLALILARRD